MLENARGFPSQSHPHAGNRLKLLHERFEFWTVEDSLAVIKEMNDAWAVRRIGFNGGSVMDGFLSSARGTTMASEAMLAIVFYMEVAKSLLSDVKLRPDAYHSMAP